MKREWKPGDVGVNLAWGYRGIFVENCSNHGRAKCWHNESGLADPGTDDRHPLVVIDPESEKDVDWLTDALIGALIKNGRGGTMYPVTVQAALRSLVNPPKPEEPTGLGAVVEDHEGRRWVRNESRDDCPWRSAIDLCWLPYAEIDAVKVLSEGVSADV